MLLSTLQETGRLTYANNDTFLTSFCYGGAGIGDTSKGMIERIWKLTASGNTLTLRTAGSADKLELVASDAIISCSLAFDSNMQPNICYHTAVESKWYRLGELYDYSGAYGKLCILDKRNRPSDVVLVYVQDGNVLVKINNTDFLFKEGNYTKIIKIGRNDKGRMQVEAR